ncbi:homoserine O-acetyltransferase, partial [Xanthomonas perforans]|nr:homoserine O-acetyltransferase [Xanthomonas perforans]
GMRMARKLGVITYRSALEWDGRFGRVRLDSEQAADDPFGLEFQVESYLEGHARRFVRFFDPNCYLYLSRSMDWFDLAEHVDEQPATDSAIDHAHADALPASAKPQTGVSTADTVLAGLARIRIARALAIGANTDILFPVQQQEQIADGLRAGGADAHFIGLDSPQGHDAFLVDFARFGPAVRDFLQDC